MIAISLKKSSEEITVHNIAENQSIQQSDFLSKTSSEANSVMANFKSPEKFLSTIYSKGNNLNKLLLLHSKESDMVILNLPVPVNQDPTQYLDYLRVLTSGLKKVLFIKNESQEVITEIN